MRSAKCEPGLVTDELLLVEDCVGANLVEFLPIEVIVWGGKSLVKHARSPVTALTRGDGFARHLFCPRSASIPGAKAGRTPIIAHCNV